ncbi:MAG: hypothetical protein R2867_00920 [Caldilineaceae bacterium]
MKLRSLQNRPQPPLQICEQLHIAPSMRAYLLGSGRLGLLVAQALALTGCDLTVIGRTAAKLDLLAGFNLPLTVHCTVTADLQPLLAYPADVVVDVTGSPQGFQLAAACPAGRNAGLEEHLCRHHARL